MLAVDPGKVSVISSTLDKWLLYLMTMQMELGTILTLPQQHINGHL